MLPDSGNCPEFWWRLGTREIFHLYRDFFNSEYAQMGHVWSCHVMLMCSLVYLRVVVYNLVHVPDSDICKDINAKIYDSSSSSSDDLNTHSN